MSFNFQTKYEDALNVLFRKRINDYFTIRLTALNTLLKFDSVFIALFVLGASSSIKTRDFYKILYCGGTEPVLD